MIAGGGTHWLALTQYLSISKVLVVDNIVKYLGT